MRTSQRDKGERASERQRQREGERDQWLQSAAGTERYPVVVVIGALVADAGDHSTNRRRVQRCSRLPPPIKLRHELLQPPDHRRHLQLGDLESVFFVPSEFTQR